MLNAANRIFGSIDGYFDRSAGPGSTISEDLYSQQAVNISYPSYSGGFYALVDAAELGFDLTLDEERALARTAHAIVEAEKD